MVDVLHNKYRPDNNQHLPALHSWFFTPILEVKPPCLARCNPSPSRGKTWRSVAHPLPSLPWWPQLIQEKGRAALLRSQSVIPEGLRDEMAIEARNKAKQQIKRTNRLMFGIAGSPTKSAKAY